ncbi:MAG: NAD-dependent epimerase/dehydratase family protein [Phycisphaeraceae bacterium]|nr:MAG: NAD-dependent epimerase/dehydratase family protein [Phycisphaeraceae bacterium]
MTDGRNEAGVVIVTGAAGFVGSNLVAEIMRRDPASIIVAVDDCRSGSFANIVEACERAGVGPFIGDFLAMSTRDLDWGDLLEAIAPDAVYHLAAITDTTVSDERLMMGDNVEGFRDLVESCALAGTPLVYASSAATYGAPPEADSRRPLPESAAGSPSNVYGFSKLVMENLHAHVNEAIAAERGERPHIVGLRYFNVFGPGESRKGKMASMAYQLASQIRSGGRPRIFTDGSQARDQVHVADVVDCTLAGAAPGVKPGVYNCGSGVATTFNDVVDAVRAGLGVSEPDAPTDYFEMPAEIRAFYQSYTCADLSTVKAGLGWSPRRKPIDAIREYAAFLASREGR